MVMQNEEQISSLLDNFGMEEGDLFKFLSSDTGSLALSHYSSARKEADANRRGGAIQRIITQIEFSSYPLKDENGPYIGYRCNLCGTHAKVRTMKRVHAKRTKEDPRQEPIPGTDQKGVE